MQALLVEICFDRVGLVGMLSAPPAYRFGHLAPIPYLGD